MVGDGVGAGGQGMHTMPLSLSPYSAAPGWGHPYKWDWWASGKCAGS